MLNVNSHSCLATVAMPSTTTASELEGSLVAWKSWAGQATSRALLTEGHASDKVPAVFRALRRKYAEELRRATARPVRLDITLWSERDGRGRVIAELDVASGNCYLNPGR